MHQQSNFLLPEGTEDIHVFQQERPQEDLTTVQGIPGVKAFKKSACYGNTAEHPECGEVISYKGKEHKTYARSQQTKDGQMKVHGFYMSWLK